MTHSPAIKRVHELLADPLRDPISHAAASTPCHLVGGALRDRIILGRYASDWDLVVLEHGSEIGRRLAQALGGQLVELGRAPLIAYRVVGKGRTIDIWDRRGEDLEHELARRDLTINSIALDIVGGDVADPQRGLEDIDRRILRANAPERFEQDPLRILRLLRFSLSLEDFDIEPATGQAARAAAPTLDQVASERIRDELDKSLSFFPAPGLTKGLVQLDLYPRLWDEDCPFADEIFLTAADEVLLHLNTLDPSSNDAALLPAFRHAVLVRTAARAGGRQEASERESVLLEGLLSNRYLSNACGRQAALLLESHGPPRDELAQRRFINQFGMRWKAAAALAAHGVEAADEDQRWLAELIEVHRRWGPQLIDPQRFLTGSDLEQGFGIKPGRLMGQILQALEQAQVEGAVASRTEATAWLRNHLVTLSERNATWRSESAD
jgi:tRNA nucleotidyltransferase (CCA-adding enzyme)